MGEGGTMKATLTVTVEQELIPRAKEYARPCRGSIHRSGGARPAGTGRGRRRSQIGDRDPALASATAASSCSSPWGGSAGRAGRILCPRTEYCAGSCQSLEPRWIRLLASSDRPSLGGSSSWRAQIVRARRDLGTEAAAAGASLIGRRLRRMPSWAWRAPATAPAVGTRPISPMPLEP